MSSIRRALVLATTERYFTMAVNFVTLITVSRIMTPEEIGISVTGTAITALALSAREFATTSYLIQHRTLTHEDVRAAFTVMLVLSGAIAGLLASTAPWLAQSYGEERLRLYLQLTALGLVLECVAAPIIALLRRDMAFDRVALINVMGAGAGAAVTITLALLGFSYMSFAWGWLCFAATTGLFAIAFRPELGIFRPLFRKWSGVLKFGGYHGANVLIYRIYESLPYLLLGRILTFDAVGLYNRSLTICQLPDKILLGGVVTVILPAFSVEVRAGRSLKRPYLQAVECITALQWPALIALVYLAYPLVDLLLGRQWLGTVPIIQILALAALFGFTAELNYPVFASLGAMRDILLRGLIIWPTSAMIVGGAAVFGLRAVAFSALLTMPLQAYVSLVLVRRHVDFSWRDLRIAVQRSMVVSLCSALGPAGLLAARGFRFDLPLGTAIVAALLWLAGWFAGLYMTRHPLLKELKNAASILAGMPRAGRQPTLTRQP